MRDEDKNGLEPESEIPGELIGGAALIDALSVSRGGQVPLGKYLASGLLPPILTAMLAKKIVHHLYKEDGEKRASAPLLAIARGYMMSKRAAAYMKPQESLRNSMAVAYAGAPPGPKTTPPGGPRKIKADTTGVTPRLPSKTRFYNDMSKANMGGGNRSGVPSLGK